MMTGQPVNLTASGVVSAQPCQLIGFYVNSTTGGTIVIKDGSASAGSNVSGTITPAIGFHWFPASLSTGCYATIANTLNVTLFTVPI